MRRVVDYKIVMDSSNDSTSAKVVEHLNDGWELYGNPYYKKGYYDYHCQVMVKYEEPPVEEQSPNHFSEDNFRV